MGFMFMSSSLLPWARLQRALTHALVVLFICFWLVILWLARPPGDTFGTDFYPLYAAGEALRRGENPYGAELRQHFAALLAAYNLPFATVGFVYPLPVIIGLMPLLLLPFPVALAVWLASGSAGSYCAILLEKHWRTLSLLPFLFMPLHRAILVKQPALIWFALAVALLFAMRWRWSWLVGYCVVMLPCKPQAGVLFALAGLYWAWQHDRRSLAWVAGWGLLIWGGAWLVEPAWLTDWIASVQHYAAVAPTPSLLPWGLLLMALCCRLPWYAQLAVAQVVLFPLSDLYSSLPLLLAWVAIGGRLALVGSACTWLWYLLALPNSITVFWALIMVPLYICAALQLYPDLQRLWRWWRMQNQPL
jgi:hypothetical protein